jgi:hypothetical protein
MGSETNRREGTVVHKQKAGRGDREKEVEEIKEVKEVKERERIFQAKLPTVLLARIGQGNLVAGEHRLSLCYDGLAADVDGAEA